MENYSDIYYLVCKIKQILTPRQADCLFLAREGYNNHDISVRLFIAESTVKKNFEDMFIRNNVNSRIQVLDIFYLALLDIIADYLIKNHNITIFDILQNY